MLLNCPIVETSALKGKGLDEVVEEAIKVAKKNTVDLPKEIFSKDVEAAIAEVKMYFHHLFLKIREDGMQLNSWK